MTDDDMHARLLQAGERWRASTASELLDPIRDEVGLEAATRPSPTPGRVRRGHYGLLATAAVLVAALMLGGTWALRAVHPDRTSRPGTPGVTALEGKVWRLVGYGSPAAPASHATLYIGPDGRLVADDTCSLLGAKIDAADGRLATSDVTTRSRTCARSAAAAGLAGRGVDILTSSARYSVARDRLTIGDRSSGTMSFVAAPDLLPPTSAVPTVSGSDWILRSATDADGRTYQGNREIFRIFDGELLADDGCAFLAAEAAFDGVAIEVKKPDVNDGGCGSEPADAVIDAVFAGHSIQAVTEGATLTLSRAGAGSLVYTWNPDRVVPVTQLFGRTWSSRTSASTFRIGAGGVVTVQDSCGSRVEHADVSSGGVLFSGPAPRSSACAGDVLSGDRAWTIRDGMLVLYRDGAQSGADVYASGAQQPDPSPTVTDEGLPGTWRMTQFTVDTGASGMAGSASGVTVTFTGDGWTASYPCGSSDVGTYTRSGDTLHLVRTASSQGSCPARTKDGGSAAVQASADVLQGDVRSSVDGDQLVLARGHTTLTFVRA